MATKDKITEILDAMKNVLIIKNERYGDSALTPIKIFSKNDSTNSICVRLDDKLSRIKNSDELRVNDICDLIGYLVLLLVSKNVTAVEIHKLVD